MNITELFTALQLKVTTAQLDPSLTGTVSIFITGSDPAQWNGRVADGQAFLEQGELPEADLTVTASSETALGLYQKTLNPMLAFMSGKIKLSGDINKIALLKKIVFNKK